ncbi:hypothetical protein B0H10DRAFT_1967107 [Mycena sp. CBHHK59/15]|nr:hypothetical protein B0H10DRAFT_1967107 [Mycena sp. CBHHK59/15]
MTDEYKGRKFESALAGPKEDNCPVLDGPWKTLSNVSGLTLSKQLRRTLGLPHRVILASEFKDRAGAPEIIQQISLQNGLNFPKVSAPYPLAPTTTNFPFHAMGHFIPDSLRTPRHCTANPVIHGTVNECLYTIYFMIRPQNTPLSSSLPLDTSDISPVIVPYLPSPILTSFIVSHAHTALALFTLDSYPTLLRFPGPSTSLLLHPYTPFPDDRPDISVPRQRTRYCTAPDEELARNTLVGSSLKPDTATRRLTFIKSNTFQKVRHMAENMVF